MRDRLAELQQPAAAEGDPHDDSLHFDNPGGRALREAAELWRALERLEQLSESIDRTQQSTQLWLPLRRYGAVHARHYARESRYQHRLKEQIQRQAELAGINLGAQDVDLLTESPQGLFIVGRDLEELKAKHHLSLAQARQRQLLELEAQMLELRGLFVQLEGLLA
ncbi:hypothetical protein DUI87_02124 [Hirundo rustica rustica]|uniref:Uncharacterized protein n=1 Tax=Hirundo rustica rustica TaxID=333673 RepID=A0A3M0L7F3_HIRRU|nr:hypothetical protein DUI87_02124 [Hirundo rustica rustica]